MLNIRTAATALATIIAASPVLADTIAAPSIFQVTLSNVEVEQDVVTLNGHPGYFDPNFPDEGFIFFDEHVRILRQEANVWDQSQIPSSPSQVPQCFADCSSPYNVVSTGSLTGTWTFDASLLAGIDTGQTGFVGPDGDISGQLLGTTSNISTFDVFSGGMQVENAVTTSTAVYAANNLALGVDGGALDVIGIVAMPEADPYIDSSGVILYMAGPDNWFETANGGIPDFTEVQVTKVEYSEISYGITPGGAVVPLYDMLIESEIAPHTLSFASFGAADGSAEDSPLLPDDADLTGDAPAFSFDVTGAGLDEDFVFIDPEIAVGYTYALQGDGTIDAFMAPTLAAVNDADGYTVILPDGTEFTLLPGEVVDFVAEGYADVTTFQIVGIDEALMIDPDDTTTFVGGFLFSGTGQGTTLTQTALVIDTDATPAVPLPAGVYLMLTGLAGLGLAARRRKAA